MAKGLDERESNYALIGRSENGVHASKKESEVVADDCAPISFLNVRWIGGI